VGTVDPSEDFDWLYDFAESLLDNNEITSEAPSQAKCEEHVIVDLLKTDLTVSSIITGLTAIFPNTDWDESRVDLFVKHVTLPLTIPESIYKTIINMCTARIDRKTIVAALLKNKNNFPKRLTSKSVLWRIVSVWAHFGMHELGNVLVCPVKIVPSDPENLYTLIGEKRNAYLDSVAQAIEQGIYLWDSDTQNRKNLSMDLLPKKRVKEGKGKPERQYKKPKVPQTLRGLVLDKLIHRRSASTITWVDEFELTIPGITLKEIDTIRSKIFQWTNVPMQFHAILAARVSPIDLEDTKLLSELKAALPVGHPEPVAELARVWIKYCVDPLSIWNAGTANRGKAPCYTETNGMQMRLSYIKTVSLFRQMKRQEDSIVI
jgi:hypothetical protein